MWLCALTGNARRKCTLLSTVLESRATPLSAVCVNKTAFFVTWLGLSDWHHVCFFLERCCKKGFSIGLLASPQAIWTSCNTTYIPVLFFCVGQWLLSPFFFFNVFCVATVVAAQDMDTVCVSMGQTIATVKALSHWQVIAAMHNSEELTSGGPDSEIFKKVPLKSNSCNSSEYAIRLTNLNNWNRFIKLCSCLLSIVGELCDPCNLLFG